MTKIAAVVLILFIAGCKIADTTQPDVTINVKPLSQPTPEPSPTPALTHICSTNQNNILVDTGTGDPCNGYCDRQTGHCQYIGPDGQPSTCVGDSISCH